MQPDLQPSFRARPAALAALLALLSGCTGLLESGRRPNAPPVVDRATLHAQLLAGYLEVLPRLAHGAPAEQAEIFAAAKRDYESAPTASHQLRYALALATPGHSAYDAPLAQRLLRELLAVPEALQPVESSLAQLELTHLDRQLALTADLRRLQADAGRSERERSATASRRLQAEIEENARLRRALEEAQAKLDAIANIERSISERKPQSPPEGRTP
ncbi:MAG: hypothetical protein IPI06_03865 [Gammaproteobacteria bacterium]|nr:hypothetical protein [Gammaproteobacteria bacterium]